MLTGPILAVWTLRAAFDGKKAIVAGERDAYAKAVLQWLLMQGVEIYADMCPRQMDIARA